MKMSEEIKRKRGRPLKETTDITPPLSYMDKKIASLKDLIVKTISEKGVKFSDAVRMCGLTVQTGNNYVKADPDFLERVTRAEIKFKAELISEIKSQGKRDWRANAFLLQHLPSFKEEFSNQSKVQIETDKTSSSQIVVNLINQVIQAKSLDTSPKEIEPISTNKVNLLEDAEEEDNE
jgi:hypothetical protein